VDAFLPRKSTKTPPRRRFWFPLSLGHHVHGNPPEGQGRPGDLPVSEMGRDQYGSLPPFNGLPQWAEAHKLRTFQDFLP
jgi:hypothetical protein